MKIKIEYAKQQYTIDADGTCYTVLRNGVNTDKKSVNYGNPTEANLGYYTTMPNAIKKIIKDGIGSSQEEITLKQYVTIIEDAHRLISEQLEGVS